MPRSPNPLRRDELEEALADYVFRNGIADLSLRPLAKALGVSTYSLTYHFGSKDEVIAAVMTRVAERQRAIVARWVVDGTVVTPGEVVLRYWRDWCLPGEFEPYHRLFYEVLGLALQNPSRFPGYVSEGAAPWLSSARNLTAQFFGDSDAAETVAWQIASVLGGALLARLVTGEVDGPSQAVSALAKLIDEQYGDHTKRKD